MDIREKLKNSILYLDGGMGTLLQKRGLRPGEKPETWNVSHPDDITAIHKEYLDAGSNVISTNTFGANILKYSAEELDDVIRCAFQNARRATELTVNGGDKYVALDIGPTGRLLEPYGDLEFEEAVSIFKETVKLGVKYGADLIFIETMNDGYETKAAVIAAKEESDLPIFVSNAYSGNGKLLTGASPAVMATMLEGMGVDALGANCSLGPKQLLNVAKELTEYSSVPVIFKPNAGLPVSDGVTTRYDVDADEFSDAVAEAVKLGVSVIGGCCGTTPEYIKKTVEKTKVLPFSPIEKKNRTAVTSYSRIVEIGKEPILVGGRINPGKPPIKKALEENDLSDVVQEGMDQRDCGAHIVDVNAGLPGIDETAMLRSMVSELQTVIDLPLQIDTGSAEAMEAALRIYNGKAVINSVNGKKECMDAIFPLMKKYGGVAIALTLDEDGIPDDVDGRIRIAEKILSEAEKYGIDRKNIIFDTLVMAVSTDKNAPVTVLKSMEHIRHEMGINTLLGIANVSFGLPARECIDAGFFASALERGVSCAIVDPESEDIMKIYRSYMTLHGMDDDCLEYIRFTSGLEMSGEEPAEVADGGESELQTAIIKGLKGSAGDACEALLRDTDPLEIVDGEIIPALDAVGKSFEENSIYLPQLLMSAEAAKCAFDKIRKNIEESGRNSVKKCAIVLATVKGDVHDIGKNIVRTLLENYSYDVIDLGKNVPAEDIVDAIVRTGAPMCGLSALMTTTVTEMEETIKLIREKAPWCRIAVGGAVLNKQYAEKIGADKYAPDAMSTVRWAESINAEK